MSLKDYICAYVHAWLAMKFCLS